MVTTTGNVKQGPKCFGQLFDRSVQECVQCDMSVSCEERTRLRGIPTTATATTRSEQMAPEQTGAVPTPAAPTLATTPPVKAKGFQWNPARQKVKEMLLAGFHTAPSLIEAAKGVTGGGKGTTALDVITKLKADGVLETRRAGKVVEYHAKA